MQVLAWKSLAPVFPSVRPPHILVIFGGGGYIFHMLDLPHLVFDDFFGEPRIWSECGFSVSKAR